MMFCAAPCSYIISVIAVPLACKAGWLTLLNAWCWSMIWSGTVGVIYWLWLVATYCPVPGLCMLTAPPRSPRRSRPAKLFAWRSEQGFGERA